MPKKELKKKQIVSPRERSLVYKDKKKTVFVEVKIAPKMCRPSRKK